MRTDMISRAEAKRLGLKRFFDGEPCKNGHVCERYTRQGQCVECNNAAFRAYRIKNPASEKARRRAYYKKAKDKDFDWYARNRTTVLAKQRARYHADAAFKTNRNTVIGRWRKNNIEVTRGYVRNRRARLRGAIGTHTAADVEVLYRKQKGKCAICLKRLRRKHHVDHKIPLSRGGGNGPDNIQLTCGPCNMAKGAKDLIAFAQENGRLLY